jgi:hypothetical protein
MVDFQVATLSTLTWAIVKVVTETFNLMAKKKKKPN